jgi:hypothetical protein
VSLVRPTAKSGSRGVQQNLFYKFWTLLQVSTNFGSLNHFLPFKTIRKIINKRHPVSGLKPTHILRCAGENGPRRRHDALPRAAGRQASWALAWRPGHALATRWGLTGGKVVSAGTGGVPGWHQAGGVEAGLTVAVARHPGVEWRCRRRGGDRRQGREGSGERRGSFVAQSGGEGGSGGAASERRGEIAAWWRKTRSAAVGFPF